MERCSRNTLIIISSGTRRRKTIKAWNYIPNELMFVEPVMNIFLRPGNYVHGRSTGDKGNFAGHDGTILFINLATQNIIYQCILRIPGQDGVSQA